MQSRILKIDGRGIETNIGGFSGGKLYQIVDIPILITVDDMQKVEDIYMIVAHISMQSLIQELSDSSEKVRGQVFTLDIDESIAVSQQVALTQRLRSTPWSM